MNILENFYRVLLVYGDTRKEKFLLNAKMNTIKILSSETTNNIKIDAFSFISIGVACNALVVLSENGILKDMLFQKYFDEEELVNNHIHPRSDIIKASLKTLSQVNVIEKKGKLWFPTPIGIDLIGNIGLLELIFSGYAKLIAKQVKISQGKTRGIVRDCDFEKIAKASDKLSNDNLENFFLRILQQLPNQGIIADLGCGSGIRLINLCQKLSRNGIGFDVDTKAIALAKKHAHHIPNIVFHCVDVTRMNKTWDQVNIILQCFMIHDIVPEAKCVKMLQSFKKIFPNMKYLIALDIVSCTDDDDKFCVNPGFEYIHSLLGIKTRTYSETLETFKKSNFRIIKEIKTEILPNTYIWVLQNNL